MKKDDLSLSPIPSNLPDIKSIEQNLGKKFVLHAERFRVKPITINVKIDEPQKIPTYNQSYQ